MTARRKTEAGHGRGIRSPVLQVAEMAKGGAIVEIDFATLTGTYFVSVINTQTNSYDHKRLSKAIEMAYKDNQWKE